MKEIEKKDNKGLENGSQEETDVVEQLKDSMEDLKAGRIRRVK